MGGASAILYIRNMNKIYPRPIPAVNCPLVRRGGSAGYSARVPGKTLLDRSEPPLAHVIMRSFIPALREDVGILAAPNKDFPMGSRILVNNRVQPKKLFGAGFASPKLYATACRHSWLQRWRKASMLFFVLLTLSLSRLSPE